MNGAARAAVRRLRFRFARPRYGAVTLKLRTRP